MSKKKILVGLSGGVDSAVAAHLLIQQGYEVIAGFMKNYSDPDNPNCTTRQDRDSAMQVAEHLGIKTFVIFDFRKEYQERIINYIYEGYKSGITPNPDVFCNNLIKFDLFLEQALKLGCDYVATGHYARIRRLGDLSENSIKVEDEEINQKIIKKQEAIDKKTSSDQSSCLLRGLDKTKDQSYFLARLSQYQLNHALFPLGELTKTQVRAIAKDIQLPNADRPDSQGLCFIGKIPMKEFLQRKLPQKPGNIINTKGEKVGTHCGAWFYTIGQRHQLYLPFRAYVTHIDVNHNILTVSEDKQDISLLSEKTTISDWYGEDFTGECLVKVRYRAEAIPAQKTQNTFTFNSPVWGITPGQIIVAYDNNEKVLGSGIIL